MQSVATDTLMTGTTDFDSVWTNLDDHTKALSEHTTTDSFLDYPVSFLDSLIPSTTALGTDSPMMDTPFLDGCTGTPFTPASIFTPMMEFFPDAVGIHDANSMETCQPMNDDVQLSSFLPCDAIAPTAAFNGDPAQLVLPKTDGCSDALFPPLPSDNGDTDIPSAILNGSGHMDMADPFALFNTLDTTMPDVTLMNSHQEQTVDDMQADMSNMMKARRKPKALAQADKRFECLICHAMFSRRFNLGTHINTHDKARKKRFMCIPCNKGFDRKHDRDRHISTVHFGERAFTCNECSSSFSRRDALARHLVQKHGYEDQT